MVRPLVILLALTGCLYGSGDDEPDVDADVTRETALDQAFHANPRWLGGDGAYTIDLGANRTLWLFGDSFIATSANLTRSESTMVRNSVAVMTGRDLATATLDFAWRDGAPPTSFFPEDGDHWFWPTDGARVPEGPLVVFLSEVRGTPDQGLGFAGVGFRAVRVPDPSDPPLAWTIEPTAAHAPAFAPTANVACSTIDDDYLVALVTGDDAHDGYLARWPLAELATGDLADPTWWTGSEWRAESTLTGAPAIVIPDGATECSLHRDAFTGQWLYIWSRGFGATTIALRNAPALTGPWSRPTDVFTPPEAMVPDAFVYAAKAHAMLPGPNGGVLITYADNSFTFGDLFDPAKAGTLYWPHVAAMLTTALAY